MPKNEANLADKCYEVFCDSLYRSISEIDETFFKVGQYGPNDINAWRERVYCYELYHQLRHHLPANFPYTLHGEINKNGNEQIIKAFAEYYKKNPSENAIKYPIPDFVIHMPRTQENLIVMEVKTSIGSDSNRKSKYKADLDKLKIFLDEDGIGYKYGIFLMYGPSDPTKILRELLLRSPNEQDKRLQILYHYEAGKFPKRII